MFSKILTFLYCCLLLNSCSNTPKLTDVEKKWLKDNSNLKVSLFADFPPYQFLNKQNNIDGVFIDYLDLIEKKIDYKFQRITYSDWEKLIDDIKNKKSDVILEIQETKSRDTLLDFFSLDFKTNFVLVTRKDTSYSNKINDYEHKNFILPKDYAITEMILNKFPNLNITKANSEYECLKQLNEGKYDAFIGAKAIVNYYIKNNKFEDIHIASDLKKFYIPSTGVLKDRKILSRILKKATASVTNKEKRMIYNKWFLSPVKPFYLKSKFWVILCFSVSLLFLSVILFNRFLKYKINQKTHELQIAKEQAEKSDQFKTNFIHNISHEIRTPMNGIMGFSELLKSDHLTTQDRKNYTDIIINNSQQLLNVIDDILAISSLQTNQTELKASPTNLNQVFDDLENNFKAEAKRKNLNLFIIKNKTHENEFFIIDVNKLKKALSNLIDNAIKFTEKGHIEVTYTIVTNKLLIKILDTGIGIKKDFETAAFKSFSQLEQEISKKYSGLGLGLTLAKQNIALIGGQIDFISQIDKGTTFIITLPYNKIEKSDISSNAINKILEKNNAYTILIVEDTDVNFLLLKAFLKKIKNYNFNIIQAKNGKEATLICEQNSFIDLIFMDIRMPIMDGYQATQIIKKTNPNIPIIAHTAYSESRDIDKAIRCGCDDFISKPVNPISLVKIVERFLTKNQLAN